MKKHLLDNVPQELSEEFFETLVSSESVTIKRIVSPPNTKSEWFTQSQNEWVTIIQGEAIIEFENGDEVHLYVNESLSIPVQQKHRVKWTVEGVNTVWLAVYYG